LANLTGNMLSFSTRASVENPDSHMVLAISDS
jgi:hypothetical protein